MTAQSAPIGLPNCWSSSLERQLEWLRHDFGVSAFDRHRGQAALADGQRHQWIQRRLACGHGQHYLVSRTAMYTECDSKCHIQAYANCDAYSYSYTYE
jgi:hypothetical protein